MKKLLLFILILANSDLFACGYYPYGEDTRISLFNPAIFGYKAYANFFYSTGSFASNVDLMPKEYEGPNIKWWFDYCQEKVDIPSIDIAVYQLKEAAINEQSQNEMIEYLYKHKDTDALNYLRFAKNCEFFNSWQEDPWERTTYAAIPKRTALMNSAIAFANKLQNTKLKRRYTFLAIRLAWYNHDFDTIQSLFANVFEKSSNKDILYYWSLYFKSFSEKNNAKANFYLAQVFSNAPDKRFVCHQNYSSTVPIELVLPLAKTNFEKANVFLLYGIEKTEKALPLLQKIYALNPASDGLSILLLREINKIEDYVFTPYYTLFEPSLSNHYDTSTHQTLNRAESDRLYAKEVLQFVHSVDLQKVENPFLLQCCKAYLHFITREYSECLALASQLEKSTTNNELHTQLQIIKALAITARQKNGSAVIPTEIQSTIIANQKNTHFIFAIGKELEYLGNTTDAALLYAKLDYSFNESSAVFWKSTKNKKHTYSDYFTNYFDYADAVYTPEQTQDLIDDIQKNQNNQAPFAIFKYASVRDIIPRLYDLLGTKYIRQNKLEKALATFEKLENNYWIRTYSAWGNEEGKFDQNPFYHLNYTPKFITPVDKIRLNKCTITKQLITYLNKAASNNEKDRDFYYFLVANAYYNMGIEGNISEMRRMLGWSRYDLSVIEDEAEFRQSILAKKYYLLAKKYAKTDKFKALCLRMVIRCERNRITFKFLNDENYQGNYDAFFATNQYYKELLEKHQAYFDDLVSNCDKFEMFFKARR